MIPEDHLLKRTDAAVFRFIRELCMPLERLAIEPEILFRMLIAGYLYEVRRAVGRRDQLQHSIQSMD